jgi:hypothetical protein
MRNGMIKRLKNNFDSGVEKLKWFSSMFSDRVKVELSVFKLLYHSEEMEKERDALLKTIGQRAYEMKAGPERNTLKDSVIADAMQEIERLNSEIESTNKKASEISRIDR